MRGLKGDSYTKKMRPTRSVLVDLWGFSVILKIIKKTLFYNIEPCISWTRRLIGMNRGWPPCFFNIINSFITICFNMLFQDSEILLRVAVPLQTRTKKGFLKSKKLIKNCIFFLLVKDPPPLIDFFLLRLASLYPSLTVFSNNFTEIIIIVFIYQSKNWFNT